VLAFSPLIGSAVSPEVRGSTIAAVATGGIDVPHGLVEVVPLGQRSSYRGKAKRRRREATSDLDIVVALRRHLPSQ